MGVRLAEQIFRFMHLICGVHRYQNRADGGRSPKRNIPCGNICCPNGNMVALFHAHGNEGAGKGIDVFPELGIGSGVVQLCVTECKLFGKLIANPV